MTAWLQENALGLILLIGGLIHTIVRVGEWKRARENAPCVSSDEMTRAIEKAVGKCVSKERYDADRRGDGHRLDLLERRFFNGHGV